MAERKFLNPFSLTKAERVVAVAAWVGVINAFVPWWFRTVTPNGPQTFNASITMAGTATWICFAGAAVLVLTRNWVWPDPAPRRDGAVYAILGACALVSLSITSFTLKSAWIGYYVAIALGAALLIGGLMRQRERRSGWM
jgi:hypothetical protein